MARQAQQRRWPLVGAALVLCACYEPREAPAPVEPACTGCHGTAKSKGAPPPGLWLEGNRTSTSDRGVGAHTAHLGATLTTPITCETCHKVPASVDDPGHLEGPVVTLGGRAALGGTKPSWDEAAGTCTVYCHAGPDAGDPKPVWNAPGSVVCGSCHGLPPSKSRGGASHPPAALADCQNCHRAVIDAAGKIIAPARHLNGQVDFN